MRQALIAAVAAAALAFAAAAGADDSLTLQPAGGGADSYASWIAQQGEADAVGSAKQALFIHHGGAPAAAALVRGVEGTTVTSLVGLSWEHRNDGLCSASDPRWTIAIQGKSGREYAVRLGCAVSAHSPGSEPGWTRDTNSQTVIRTRILRDAGADALGGRIEYLAIVSDKQRGDAWLDNVQVVAKGLSRTWTSAADNGSASPAAAAAALAVDGAPLTATEQTSADELVASLTPDEQYAITDEAIAAG